MNNLGLYIREKREQRNMTIEELSKRTLISPAVLKDIEAGKFDRYTGDEAYVKMYLKKISEALEMDTKDVTEQYIALTREIELDRLKELDEIENRNIEVVEKGKKFTFETPKLARKPSVYENRSHLSIIRGAIILLIVCLIVGICWYGFSATNSQSKDPSFKPQNGPVVDGDVDIDNPEDNDNNQNNTTVPPVVNNDIVFNRAGELDFEFSLPENTEEFTFKIEFRARSWAELSVNGKTYKKFLSKIYNSENNSEEPDVVELTFEVADFEKLDLRNGYSMGHRYYINGVEVPLTEDDYSEGPSNFILTLVNEPTE